MKTITVRMEDSLVEEVRSFLHSLPEEKIRIIEHPYSETVNVLSVSEEEQKEIEALLENDETRVFERRRNK